MRSRWGKIQAFPQDGDPGGRIIQSGRVHDRERSKNSSNLLGRRRELEELEHNVKTLEA